jgi:hypothetical protein
MNFVDDTTVIRDLLIEFSSLYFLSYVILYRKHRNVEMFVSSALFNIPILLIVMTIVRTDFNIAIGFGLFACALAQCHVHEDRNGPSGWRAMLTTRMGTSIGRHRDLRHTFASDLRLRGLPLEDIWDLLGDSSSQTTGTLEFPSSGGRI